jgi:hypothetical protein
LLRVINTDHFRRQLLFRTPADYHSLMIRVLVMVLMLSTALAPLAISQAQAPNAPKQQSQDEAFGDAAGAAVLHDFGGALEAHSLTRFLATFDAASYPRFPTFAGEMDSFFGRFDQFRVHYLLKETSATSEGHGTMLAQMQIEEVPISGGEAVRHTSDVRFEMVRAGGKWKIAGFTPREFLS